MWYLILGILLAVCAAKWIQYRILLLALVCFMEQKQYQQPTKEEFKKCGRYVGRKMGEDLFGRKN